MDWITQFFTSYKLTLHSIITFVIIGVATILTLSVRGCIKKDSIIAEQSSHIESQENIIDNMSINIQKAKIDNKIIEIKKNEVKEKLIYDFIDFDKNVNRNFENFNNIENV